MFMFYCFRWDLQSVRLFLLPHFYLNNVHFKDGVNVTLVKNFRRQWRWQGLDFVPMWRPLGTWCCTHFLGNLKVFVVLVSFRLWCSLYMYISLNLFFFILPVPFFLFFLCCCCCVWTKNYESTETTTAVKQVWCWWVFRRTKPYRSYNAESISERVKLTEICKKHIVVCIWTVGISVT